MDPVLSSVLQTNRIGSDGFVWWIGQIESSADGDFKNGGRFRVRIVGEHLKSCDATPTEQLPWAQSMMPLTHPYSDGGTTGGSVNLQPGNWVLGFFLDPVEKQKPMIMGSIAHTPGSTVVKNEILHQEKMDVNHLLLIHNLMLNQHIRSVGMNQTR